MSARPLDARLRASVATTLRIGMLLAVACIGVGIVAGLVTGDGLDVDESQGLAGALLAGRPGSIVLFGVLLLTLTPVAQMIASAIGFGRAGDRRYLLIALVVLALLLGSLVIAVVATTGPSS